MIKDFEPINAVEIARSRFIDSKAASQLSFIADNAGLHALIIGDKLVRGRWLPPRCTAPLC